MNNDEILKILKSQVAPAIGCTEPVSVAIAVATAYKQVPGDLKTLNIETSLNIFKNGMRVGIPGTVEKGLEIASALAIVCGDPELELEIFRNVDEQCVKTAKDLVDRKLIKVTAGKEEYDFFVNVHVETSAGTGECVIIAGHTNVVSIKKDGYEVFSKPLPGSGSEDTSIKADELKLDHIFSFVETVDSKEIEFLLEGAKMNLAAAEIGRSRPYSSGLGVGLFKLIEKGTLSNELSNKIRGFTAAACDARMAGLKIPVMSSAGSGNHGITAILPVAILAAETGKSDEELTRSLALSHLLTGLVKQHTGRLSPVCGCAVAAGIGAAAALTWIQGGSREHVEMVVDNMIAGLSGMVCDGAKGGCSYKVSAAASEAYYQSLVALGGTKVESCDGIVGKTVADSIANLGALCRTGMKEVDRVLVQILSNY